MNINDLFCTPKQGRRLAELVPELTSVYMHVHMHEKNSQTVYWTIMETRLYKYSWQHRLSYPALTLQELRDVASEHHMHRRFRLMGAERLETWQKATASMTAPELAAWVIERLEEHKDG
jgi:hypothetical protein